MNSLTPAKSKSSVIVSCEGGWWRGVNSPRAVWTRASAWQMWIQLLTNKKPTHTHTRSLCFILTLHGMDQQVNHCHSISKPKHTRTHRKCILYFHFSRRETRSLCFFSSSGESALRSRGSAGGIDRQQDYKTKTPFFSVFFFFVGRDEGEGGRGRKLLHCSVLLVSFLDPVTDGKWRLLLW